MGRAQEPRRMYGSSLYACAVLQVLRPRAGSLIQD